MLTEKPLKGALMKRVPTAWGQATGTHKKQGDQQQWETKAREDRRVLRLKLDLAPQVMSMLKP